MRNKSLLFLILLVFAGMNSLPQVISSRDIKDIGVSWRLVSNNYKGKPEVLSEIIIENKGHGKFPAKGWTIYFNYNREIFPESVSGDISVEHVNGDIYRMQPGKQFKGISPGQSSVVSYVSEGEILNFTSTPYRFYLVRDNEPDKGELIESRIDPIVDPGVGFVTPLSRYQKNEPILDIPENSLVKVFPTPVNYRESSGSFLLDQSVCLHSDPDFDKEASYLLSILQSNTGIQVRRCEKAGSARTIELKKDTLPEGAYRLEVSPGSVIITASSGEGIFYGIQSLFTLIPPKAFSKEYSSAEIPSVQVSDAPRFNYRGLLLDIARNFQSKQELKRVLDLMALYKLNVLQLHFSDDEGWRIEIPSLPELTEVGSRRGHTLDSWPHLPPSYGSGPAVGKSQGSGYYSQADFIEILKYATERHIMVVPEIESPGHARAAIKSMDARYRKYLGLNDTTEARRYLLRDLNDKSVYNSAQNWTDNVMCVALPSVYSFLEVVVDGLVQMYSRAGAPLSTIHLGGDEVPQGVWEGSPLCQQLIKSDPALAGTDDLWYYYYRKADEILKARNLALSGWEEVAMRKTLLDSVKHFIPNPDFVNNGFRVNVWNNGIGWGSEDLPYRLANAGYKVILSCVSNLYCDLAYEKSPDEPGYYWGGFQDIDKPFYFIPFDYYRNTLEDTQGNPVSPEIFIGKDRLTDYGKKNILGIQGLLWAENIHDTLKLEYMLLPKLLSLAERAWAKDPAWASAPESATGKKLYNQDYSAFLNVLGKRELPRLEYFDGGFNYRIPTPGASLSNGEVSANLQIPGFTLRYTTDGSEPNEKSPIYSGPVKIKDSFRIAAFSSKARQGKTAVILK